MPNIDLLSEQQLQKSEEQLLQPQTRKSANDISALLADKFIEIGSSGRIFNKQQMINSLLKRIIETNSFGGFQNATISTRCSFSNLSSR